MNNKKSNSPKLAKILLDIILPTYVKDEICGDLEEEFNLYIKKEKGDVMANRWFWRQSLITCVRYLFIKQRLLAALTIIMAISISAMLYIAITSLSYGNKAFFNDDFWYNGKIHLLFFETKFWSFTSNSIFESLPLMHLVDSRSAIWACLALLSIFKLDLKYQFSTLMFSILSVGLMFSPYFYGVITFQITTLSNKEVGPLIALMWLPIMYMILPITYLIIIKLTNSNKNSNIVN